MADQILRRLTGNAGAPSFPLLSGQFAWNSVDGKLYFGDGDTGTGISTSNITVGIKNPAPLASPQFTGQMTLNTSYNYGKLSIGGDITSVSPNYVAITAGSTQGEKSGYSFFTTFMGGSDNSPRRSADILSGFNAANWGTEYLAFNVGYSGANNDAKNLTTERMRINGSGEVLIGTGISDSSILQVRRDQNAETALSIKNTNTGTSAISSVKLSVSSANTDYSIKVKNIASPEINFQSGTSIINAKWYMPNYRFYNTVGTSLLLNIDSSGNGVFKSTITGSDTVKLAGSATSVDKTIQFFSDTGASATGLRFALVGASNNTDGGNLYFKHYNDTGVFQNNSASIARSTGTWTFTNSPIIPTPLTSDNSTKSASTAYVQSNLSNYAQIGHTQAISTIIGLQTALDNKQSLNTTLTSLSSLSLTAGSLIYAPNNSSLSNLSIGTEGQILMVNGGVLGWTTPSTITIPVTSVAGKTGAVVLNKGDIGLANVDNTTDLNKPISTATQTALNNTLQLTGGSLTGKLSLSASNSSRSTVNIPTGVAPSAPIEGDIWKTSSKLYSKVNNNIAAFVFDNTTISTGTGLTGGGDLTSNRTISVDTTWFDARYLGINANASSSSYSLLLSSQINNNISPSSLSTNKMQFGFGSWDNNNDTTYADYLHFRSSNDISNGNENLLMLNKSVIGLRIYQQSFGSSSIYSTFKDVAFTDGSNSTGTWGISITGNSATTTALATGRTISLSGAVTGSTTFNGTANASITTSIANSSLTYSKIQNVSATSRILGRITAGAGVIEELTPTNMWTLLGTVPTGNLPSFSGDATSTAGTSTLTLATVNTNVGTFGSASTIPSFTVNGKGLITAVSNTTPSGTWGINITGNSATTTALATGRTISLSGDLSGISGTFDGTSNISFSTTLATVNTNVGTFGSASTIPSFTVNGKGLITAVSNTTPSGTWGINITGNSASVGGTTPSTFGLSLIDDVDSSTARTTLGIGNIATRSLTVSSSAPYGGASGDVWFLI